MSEQPRSDGPPSQQRIVETLKRDVDGKYWLGIRVDGEIWAQFEFGTLTERERAHEDFNEMMRTNGAMQMPNYRQ